MAKKKQKNWLIVSSKGVRNYAGPLDTLALEASPLCAYSVRRLTRTYLGSAFRVRATTGGAEQDIGFTSAGDLDTSALTTFLGASSGTIVTWYDQIGSVNPTNASAAGQPTIATTGTVNVRGTSSRPFIAATNAHVLISASSITLEASKRFSTFATSYMPNTGGGTIYRQWFGQYSVVNFHHATARSGTALKHYDGAWRNASTAPNDEVFVEAIIRDADTALDHWENGSETTGGVTMSDVARGSAPLCLFNISSAPSNAAFEIAEIIHFDSDLSTSANAISANMGAYYGVSIDPP